MALNLFTHLAALAAIVLILPAVSAAPAHTARTQHLSSADQVPEGLSAPDWSSIRRQYEQHRHAAFPVMGALDTLQARNPGQQWRTRFDGRGFITQPDSGGWQWGLELCGYGFSGHERLSKQNPRITTSGQRVTYDWDDTLQEWFVNDARGLEHGFTLRERPASIRSSQSEKAHYFPGNDQSLLTSAATERGIEESPLIFNLTVRGGLRPEVQGDGRGVNFMDANGATALTYTGLIVLDADGRKLPARFEPVELARGVCADPQTVTASVRLVIDERDARYPLTIDPIAQQAYLKASNPGARDYFGTCVAISGDTVVVGAPQEDSSVTGVNGDGSNNSALNSGAAYVFVRSSGVWTLQAYLKASNTGGPSTNDVSSDQFGASVAVSGNTLVIGAPGEDSNATGINGNGGNNSALNSGAAYVFVRSGTIWTQQAYLKASNNGDGDRFGGSVAVSSNTVVIGAYGEDSNATGIDGNGNNNSAIDSGAAYVFVRSGTVWTQQAYLKASNTGVNDNFGVSVAVSSNTVVVGAPQEDSNATGVNGDGGNNSARNSGAAYVFLRSGTNWAQQAYLKASNTGGPSSDDSLGDSFGASVSVSGDTVVVGAPREDSSATGVNGNGSNNSALSSGAAYVFVRSGPNWSQQAYLKASNTGSSVVYGDLFGTSVSVWGDTVVVGAYFEDGSATGVNGTENNSGIASGAAYLFVRVGTTWTQQGFLKASNTEEQDLFGYSVAVSSDAVVVGAYLEDGNSSGVNGDQWNNCGVQAGAAYVFDLYATNGSPILTVEQPPCNPLTSPSSIVDFGNTSLNDRSPRTFTIRDTGYGALIGLNVSITGPNASAFTLTEAPLTSVPGPWGSTPFIVTFSPSTLGTKTAVLHITTSDTNLPPFDISLIGTGVTAIQIAQQAYLKGLNTEFYDRFGTAVAASGDTVVVGAPGESSNASGVNGNGSNNSAVGSGAAYVFVRSGTIWKQQAYLKASNPNAYDNFGFAVGISGNTIVVGALGESSSGIASGAAYVFVRDGTNWSQQAILKASNAEEYDYFGGSVAISGDTIVVGADSEDSTASGVNGNQTNNDADSAGAAYVFVRNGTAWSQQAYLKASNPGGGVSETFEYGDRFGYCVSVSSNTVLVGALYEDSNAIGINGNQNNNSATNSGAAYIFVRNGGVWTQQAYLKASNTDNQPHDVFIGDNFGLAVAVAGDTAVMGAQYEDSNATGINGNQNNNAGTNSGAAYVFVRNGTNWSQQAYLKGSNTEGEESDVVGDLFGLSTAISESGNTIVVGATQEDSNAMGINGNQNNNSADSSGAAYVFVRNGGVWSQQAYLKASNTGALENFGIAVAASGDVVVVGANEEDSNAIGVDGNQGDDSAAYAGAAYVFVGLGPGNSTSFHLTPTKLSNGTFQLTFETTPNTAFTVLATTNLSLPLANWTVIGAATETPAGSGHYQFTEPAGNSRRLYRVRSP